jgi:hypothetical protein
MAPRLYHRPRSGDTGLAGPRRLQVAPAGNRATQYGEHANFVRSQFPDPGQSALVTHESGSLTQRPLSHCALCPFGHSEPGDSGIAQQSVTGSQKPLAHSE